MKTKCPHCGKINSIPEGYIVDQMACLECGQTFEPKPFKCHSKVWLLCNKAGQVLAMFGIIVMCVIWISMLVNDAENPSKTQVEEKISNITFESADRAYEWAFSQVAYMPSDTSLQIEARGEKAVELIEQNYIGKRIRWRGEVVNVYDAILGDGICVKFRHKPDTIFSDVTALFKPDMKSVLLNLKAGDIVTYEGRIKSIGSGWSNHDIDGYKIVNVYRQQGRN
jgi:hypothetical protein